MNAVHTCAFTGHDAIGPHEPPLPGSGEFASIDAALPMVREWLAAAAGVRAGQRVLELAAGDGHPSLAAASRMPFDDGAVDVVLATFGAHSTPSPHQVARELLRVTRHGGSIGLADWTPEGFPGRLLGVIAGILAPAGARSPLPWGSEPRVVELFGPHAAELRCLRRRFNLRGRPAMHWPGIFRATCGPTHAAFAALDAARRAELATAIEALLEPGNFSGPGSPVVPCDYLEIVITRS